MIDYVGSTVTHEEVIIQERNKTNERVFSCCGLAIEGRIMRSFKYVKLRQHPDQFITGTFLRIIYRPVLLERAGRITSHFSYTGIFEIEFIETPDRHLSVIEMNPRHWKSIHFAALCGQNFCRAYNDYLICGSRAKEDHRFETNRTWVDLIMDLPKAIKQSGIRGLRYEEETLHCVADSKGRIPILMEILLSPFLALDI